jgi:hypothetical protein
VPSPPRLWLAVCGAPPLLLLVGRLLPPEGPGLAFRLAGAACCVLILPGAFADRIVGGPRSIGLALATALAWSLVLLFGIFAVLFAVSGTLGLGVGLLGGTMAAGFAFSLRSAGFAFGRDDLRAALGLTGAGAALAGALWWATGTIGGSLGPTVSDALFHLARVRKLDEAGHLGSIGIVDELAGGHVHPGYAFPLWHGALALVARLAGVDPSLVVLYLPAVLVPLAVLLAYAAGHTLFRSWTGGVATVAGQLALVAFARDGVGWLQYLAQPGGASRLLLIPGLLALVFAYVSERSPQLLAGAAASGFVLAVIHSTYLVFVLLLIAGLLLARSVLGGEKESRLLLVALAALLVPAGLFLAWLAQFVEETGTRPSVRFDLQTETVDGGLRLRPEQIAFGGGVKVLALLLVPLVLLSGGKRFAAYVLGGTAALLVLALVPLFFEPFATALSLSQAVRLPSFLPLPFALAAGALLASRLRAVGVGAALLAALGLELAYPHDATGAVWVVWLAALGATIGLAVHAFTRPRRLDLSEGRWPLFAALALVLPVAVHGFTRFERWDDSDPYGLSPGLVQALRTDVPPLAVVLSPAVTSYRIAGEAPVRIVVAPPGHVAFNTEEAYRLRSRAARLFFLEPGVSAAERETVLRRYGVDWVVVDKTRGQPDLPPSLETVYEDARYALYRAGQEAA